MALISVIVPVYNVADYIEACLDSILSQSYSELEIVVVDDGSTDASGEIAIRYAKQDSRIKLIRQDNRGVSAARNVALEQATGKYVTFVDSDDVIEPEYIETLYQNIKDCDMVISCVPKNELKGYNNIVGKLISDKAVMASVLSASGYTWGKLIKKEAIDNGFLFGVKYAEDYLFYLKLLNSIDNIRVIEYYGYKYTLRADSLSVKDVSKGHSPKEFYNKYTFVEAFAEMLKLTEGWKREEIKVVKDHCYYVYILILKIYIESGTHDSKALKRVKQVARKCYLSFLSVTLLRERRYVRFAFGTIMLIMPKLGTRLSNRLL